MSIILRMPALSPTMTQGHVVKWHKKEGDVIEPGQSLLDIETDKAVMDVEAVDAGTLFHIFIPQGTRDVTVGRILAVFQEDENAEDMKALVVRLGEEDQEGDQKGGAQPAAQDLKDIPTSSQPAATPQMSAPSPAILNPMGNHDQRIKISPLAKKVAHIHDIPVENIKGSGPGGRIIRNDVLEAQQKISSSSAPLSPSAQAAPISAANPSGPGTFEDIPFSGMRKAIASRLTQAKQTIPHFYMTMTCDMEGLIAARTQLNHSLDNSLRLSVNDFILKATALALRDFPDMNVQVYDQGIKKFSQVDLAVAVSLDEGLITPILFNAAELSLLALSKQLKSLVARARQGQLKPQEFQGGTFTVSNLGMFQLESFQAIVNPPQAGILAVSATLEQPVVREGKVVPGHQMKISLSADHRAVDGVLAARFLKKVQYYIEHPLLLMCA